MKDHFGDPKAVLVVDETGFIKKGKKSAGVMRQYSGTAGRIENSQIGVFLTYAAHRGFSIIDRELYLPKEWTEDRPRCRASGIPDEIEFRTKPWMALNMIKAAYAAEMPFAWVTGDSVYGDYRHMSMWLESVMKGYVMAVSGKAYVRQGLRQHRVSGILEALPEDGWDRMSAGTGAKGERYYDWLSIPLDPPPAVGWKKCLLIRRSITKPEERRAFLCFFPEQASLDTPVKVADIRWTIEQSFEEAKGGVGLDHYEVRSYSGWYKYITWACWAMALLAVLKIRAAEPDFQAAIVPSPSKSMEGFKKGRNLSFLYQNPN